MDGERTQSGLESAVVNALTTNGVNTNELDINVTTSGVAVAKKKIYTADEIAADSNIFAIGKTNANDIIGIYNPDTKTLTIKNNNTTGNGEIKNATYSTSLFSTLKTTLENVVIENGITNISDYLFKDFSNLKNVTVSKSVKKIGKYAFYNCKVLTGVNLISGLELISDYAFYKCEGLTTIELPEGVVEIKSRAFSDCTNLAKITIPSTVTTVGGYAVSGKTTSILFGEEFDITLPTVDEKAFATYSSSAASALTNYDFATRYGDNTTTTIDCPIVCSSTETLHDYKYVTNITVNNKTRQMVYHYKIYPYSCTIK